MIKLICSDIDGTLVKDGSIHMNPEIFDVILKLKEHGIHFAAASGRQAASIEKVFAPIKDKIFYIAENGGYIGCYGRTLFVQKVKKQKLTAIVEELRAIGDCEIMLSGPRTAYVESHNQEFLDLLLNEYHYELKQLDDVLDNGDEIVKLSVYRSHDVDAHIKSVTDKWQSQMQIATAGAVWVDFMEQNVNKGSAVRELQTALHISYGETMAFGDQLNDIQMLQEAYFSHAVANARPETKEAARFEAGSYTDNGVLTVLKNLLETIENN